MKRYKYIYILLVFAALSCGKDNAPKEIIPEVKKEDVLLFSKNPNGFNELYKLENGIETIILSNPDYDYWWPKVSPDKKKLLVYRSLANPSKNHDNYANAELIRCDIDGTNAQIIIEKNKYGWVSQGVCRWNKDGTKILMGAEIDINGSVQWRLVITDTNGEQPKILSDYWGIDCNFSTDDAFVYFVGFADNNLTPDPTQFEILRGTFDTMNDTLTNIVSITSNTTRDHDPDIAPDNHKIVFSAGNSDYTDVDLVLYDIAAEEESILLNDKSSNGGSMCWAQDGKSVYFHSVTLFETPFRIKKININTGVTTTILEVANNNHGFFHPESY